MRMKLCMTCFASAVMVFSLMLAGCSDDESGGTGPTNTISAEDQFDQIDDFIDLDFDGDDNGLLGIDATTLGLGSLNFVFMDGVTESDFESLGDEIPGLDLGKRVPGGIRASSVSFSYSDGWWNIHVDSVIINSGMQADVDFTTQVRFEDAGGMPQMIPDENTTKYTEVASIDVSLDFVSAQGTFDIGYNLQSQGTVDGLNTTSLLLNTSNSATITALVENTDLSTVDMELTVDGETSDVVFPGEGCPTSGSLNAVIGLDLAYVGNEGTFNAAGTWNLGLDVQSDGTGNVTVSSGDFTKTATTNLCDEDE